MAADPHPPGGYISVWKLYLFPSFWKWYFSPIRYMSFFDTHHGLFALILLYFAFILPFYFPFSHFLSTFFLFHLHFPPFSLCLFIFFPHMTSADIPPPGGYFPKYRLLPPPAYQCAVRFLLFLGWRRGGELWLLCAQGPRPDWASI
jgi:hypothetical protein